ncbi:unnamed protein product [Angiostrongylus costaricensis]|uniref:Site-specific DNA-methyltransferase (adenine-specific) n=1 Tax=Angiostrongylus costaricensis TaxID=334426 RepID=A0A158PJ19_ANGCS|nr:unnamed protein product [Angiostrongylus costaricensis]
MWHERKFINSWLFFTCSYEQLVEMKTSHYTFFQPVEMAMLVSDRMDHHRVLRHLLYKIGFLFQSQDDHLDVFGNPHLTGKTGTDIQDGKCTWISVRAVQKLLDKPELDVFKANYGRGNPENVDNIRNLLYRLDIQEDFMNFEKKYSDKLKNDINQVPLELSPLKPVLRAVVTKLQGREK